MARRHLATLALSVLLGGCASVKFYSDPEHKHETGLKIYAPKPYLLVTRYGSSDKKLEATVLYLPDQTKVSYAVITGGTGSHDISFKLANGILTEYGEKIDSKFNETLTALGSLLSAAGAGYKSYAEAIAALHPPPPAKLMEADLAGQIDAIAQNLGTSVERKEVTLSPDQRNKGREVAKALGAVASELRSGKPGFDFPSAIEKLVGASSALDALYVKNATLPPDIEHNKALPQVKREIEAVIRSLRILSGASPEPPPPSFELYEIDTQNGKLIPVTLPKI